MDSPPPQHAKSFLRKQAPGASGMVMEGENEDYDMDQDYVATARADLLVHTNFYNNFSDDFDDDDLL
ncbi:hypothetical protein Ae201684P_017194 [Aphanomyces euteiches]|uniref:Uncharacterized protein n=1 Tax=Aphanomyces euteiches TaxID=100861 RepID=A0A6G0W9E4_9STRA|nr:hypothetical protein Ae201684_017399 [Aphanomyces euteiches]KAH9088585.1 hypothetical protein Ae201684P_017194 [Aphanomyces euteiches]